MKVLSKNPLSMTNQRIKPQGFVVNMVLPLVALVVILWMDHKTPGVTLTPLFAGIAILLMAFTLTFHWVCLWTLIYSMAVLGVFLLPLWGFFIGWSSPPVSVMTHYIRGISFLITALLGINFSRTLRTRNQLNNELVELLENLPVPVITSDRNGVVKFMNRSMDQLLGNIKTSDDSTFFDLFSPVGRQGETISAYLARFSQGRVGLDDLIPVEIHGKPLLAKTRLMQSFSPPILVTVIEDTPAV